MSDKTSKSQGIDLDNLRLLSKEDLISIIIRKNVEIEELRNSLIACAEFDLTSSIVYMQEYAKRKAEIKK